MSNGSSAYTDHCASVISELLGPYANTIDQFPIVFWSQPGCTGIQYPPTGEFPQWEQQLKASEIGMQTIGSLYVAPHVLLTLWSKDGTGFYSVPATPSPIVSTAATPMAWTVADGTPCPTNDGVCGHRIEWDLGSHIDHLRAQRLINWNMYTHNLANNKQVIQVVNQTIPLNNDLLFQELCQNGSNLYTCQCHDAYIALLATHPQSVQDSYINITQNGCDPKTIYAPSKAPIGSGTQEECMQMYGSQLQYGTHKTVSEGGGVYVYCGNQVFQNASEPVHSTTSTASSSTYRKNANSTLFEKESTSALSSTSLITMISLILVGLVLLWVFIMKDIGGKTSYPIRHIQKKSRLNHN